ncbi:MAG: TM2 domain-containing protein [Faecalibacterium sp.]|nr:TM2 domain-containing protein [Ruminococcus sp.]MCM1391382.1 TM2 domain-containing protein [Ruminococcus sp.]MCM1484592.1 TM2 domain-containing protein [Faecalibacterium sp.]
MYCKNCGKEIADNAAVCVNCGVSSGKGNNFCHSCGAATNPEATVCVKCGVNLNKKANSVGIAGEKKKWMAVVLAILFGEFGVHDFYLGYNKRGLIKLISLLVGAITAVFIVGFIIILAIIIWIIVDIIRIVTGKMTDSDGNELV